MLDESKYFAAKSVAREMGLYTKRYRISSKIDSLWWGEIPIHWADGEYCQDANFRDRGREASGGATRDGSRVDAQTIRARSEEIGQGRTVGRHRFIRHKCSLHSAVMGLPGKHSKKSSTI